MNEGKHNELHKVKVPSVLQTVAFACKPRGFGPNSRNWTIFGNGSRQAGCDDEEASTPQGAGQVGANSVLYFRATDIEQYYVDMLGRGAKAERAPQLAAKMPDHELWIGFVRDPDGNLVGLMEEKR